MSQFEFTKEQREAWRVIEQLAEANYVLKHIDWIDTVCAFNNAASRFDAREKTCGIEPLSEEHFILGALNGNNFIERTNDSRIFSKLRLKGIVKWDDRYDWWDITDRGREVLTNLNAMCKVSK